MIPTRQADPTASPLLPSGLAAMTMTTHDFYNAPLATGGFTHAAQLLAALQRAAGLLGIVDADPQPQHIAGAAADEIRAAIVAATGGTFAAATRAALAAYDAEQIEGGSPYARRVAQLEADGLTTSDAQAIADAEGLDD